MDNALRTTKVCLQKSCTSGLDMHDTKAACEADGFSWIPLRGAITNETECTSNGHEWKQLSASFCMEREDTDMTENQCIVGTLDHPGVTYGWPRVEIAPLGT